jgi:hypothetical protein
VERGKGEIMLNKGMKDGNGEGEKRNLKFNKERNLN